MSADPDTRDLPYDPQARRDTPLAMKLKERIGCEGPISLSDYWVACLWDAEFGYYSTRKPIGAAGDFTTAPEISQVFGELIGGWAAVVWQQMGAPSSWRLTELGPGRGTMLADALRLMRKVPGLLDGAELELIEKSKKLAEVQRATLADAAASCVWRENMDLRPSPSIVIGNEYLDCKIPLQSVKMPAGWQDREVILDLEGRLAFAVSDNREPRALEGAAYENAPLGSVFEDNVAMTSAIDLWLLAENAPLAALFIDYGGMSDGLHDTLQAVRNHKFEHPLTSPGEADLTAQVNFAEYKSSFEAKGLIVDGPVTQAEFLGSLGIMERASRLMSANPHLANEIEMGVSRLMAVPGMGDRFKAIGVRSPALPPLPGF